MSTRPFDSEECFEKNISCDEEGCDNDISSIDVVFAILHTLLCVGSKERQPIEEKCLNNMVAHLGLIAKYERSIELSDEAIYLASKILSRHQDDKKIGGNIRLASTGSRTESIDECLASSCGATRAFGVSELLSKLKFSNEVNMTMIRRVFDDLLGVVG